MTEPDPTVCLLGCSSITNTGHQNALKVLWQRCKLVAKFRFYAEHNRWPFQDDEMRNLQAETWLCDYYEFLMTSPSCPDNSELLISDWGPFQGFMDRCNILCGEGRAGDYTDDVFRQDIAETWTQEYISFDPMTCWTIFTVTLAAPAPPRLATSAPS